MDFEMTPEEREDLAWEIAEAQADAECRLYELGCFDDEEQEAPALAPLAELELLSARARAAEARLAVEGERLKAILDARRARFPELKPRPVGGSTALARYARSRRLRERALQAAPVSLRLGLSQPIREDVASGVAGSWAEDVALRPDVEVLLVVDTDDVDVAAAVRRYRSIWRRAGLERWGAEAVERAFARIEAETGVPFAEAAREAREVEPEELARDREMSEWLLRDDVELAREAKAAAERTRKRDELANVDGKAVRPSSSVVGDYWGSGPAAEKLWLEAQISQLRIKARELVQDGRRKGFEVDPLSDPQVQAIRRHALSLRHRHNFKRYVEVLAGDVEFAEAWPKAEAWRREKRLTYTQAEALFAKAYAKRRLFSNDVPPVLGLVPTTA